MLLIVDVTQRDQAKRLILMRNRSTPKQDTNFSKSNTFHHFWFLIDVYVGDYIAWKLNAYNQFWTTCLSKKILDNLQRKGNFLTIPTSPNNY